MTLVGNIKDLGISPYSSITLTFELIGHMGTKIVSVLETGNIPQIQDTETTTETDGSFSVTLDANEAYKRKTYYKLTVSNRSFLIYIPKNSEKINIKCVLNEIDYDDIAELHDLADGVLYDFNENFIKKFEKYILNQPQNLTRAEEKMCEKFLNTADLDNTEKSTDTIQLDNKLGSL